MGRDAHIHELGLAPEDPEEDEETTERGPESHPELALLRALVSDAVGLQGELNYRVRVQAPTYALSAVSGELTGLKRAIAHVLVHHYGRDAEDSLTHVERLVSEHVLRADAGDEWWDFVQEAVTNAIVEQR